MALFNRAMPRCKCRATQESSRDDRLVLAQTQPSVRFVRGSEQQAKKIVAFLEAQKVRPVPTLDDVRTFTRASGNALFLALCGDRIVGCAGCSPDGLAITLTYFALEAKPGKRAAAELLAMIERHARALGGSVLIARVARHSPGFRSLRACGFVANWEEGDVVDGRRVDVVDLVKTL